MANEKCPRCESVDKSCRLCGHKHALPEDMRPVHFAALPGLCSVCRDPWHDTPAQESSGASLKEAINQGREAWQAKHGKCSMCAAGDVPVDGWHRGLYVCGNIEESSRSASSVAGERPKWVIVADGEGAQACIIASGDLHESVHRFMCCCGKPWRQCEADMVWDIEQIDKSEDWITDEDGQKFSLSWPHETGKITLYKLSDAPSEGSGETESKLMEDTYNKWTSVDREWSFRATFYAGWKAHRDAESRESLEKGSGETRVRELRFGIERIIEKAKYDEYGTFENVRERIVALCQEILDEDAGRLSRPAKEKE